jgi:hypothetical protein
MTGCSAPLGTEETARPVAANPSAGGPWRQTAFPWPEVPAPDQNPDADVKRHHRRAAPPATAAGSGDLLQVDLPFRPAGRVRRGKVVAARPEQLALYEAVLLLRKAGYRVRRAGVNHLVDDRHLSSTELLKLAAAHAKAHCHDRDNTHAGITEDQDSVARSAVPLR